MLEFARVQNTKRHARREQFGRKSFGERVSVVVNDSGADFLADLDVDGMQSLVGV